MGNKLDFYTVNIEYVKYLHRRDSEVFYDENNLNYDAKPYIGIITTIDNFSYFIPLTSAKEKHKTWKTNGKSHLIISEDIKDNKHINKNSIIKDIYNNKGKIINKKRLLSVVACNKAIPIPTKVAGVFERLIINGNKNESLLRKELLECRRKTNTIINKSTKIIKDQKENGTQIFESKYF